MIRLLFHRFFLTQKMLSCGENVDSRGQDAIGTTFLFLSLVPRKIWNLLTVRHDPPQQLDDED